MNQLFVLLIALVGTATMLAWLLPPPPPPVYGYTGEVTERGILVGGRTATGGPPPNLPTAITRPARCPPGTVIFEKVWRFGSAYRGTDQYAPRHWDLDPYKYGEEYGRYVWRHEYLYWYGVATTDYYSRPGNYWLEHVATYTFDVPDVLRGAGYRAGRVKVEMYVSLYKAYYWDIVRLWLDFSGDGTGRWVDLGYRKRGVTVSGWHELGTVDGGTHTVSLWFRYGPHYLYAVGLRITCT